jgi:hypothetical protein
MLPSFVVQLITSFTSQERRERSKEDLSMTWLSAQGSTIWRYLSFSTERLYKLACLHPPFVPGSSLGGEEIKEHTVG